MSSTSDLCIITPNPDIIGIGIRLSIYILSLAGPLISSLALSRELLNAVEGSLGVTGMALLITTFISAAQKELDLFHAVCLFHLVGLVGLSIRSGERKAKSSARRYITQIMFYAGTGGFLIFMIYLFSTMTTFGQTPQCNDQVIYVMFGVNVKSTDPVFRGVFLFSLALGLVGLIVGLVFMAFLDEDHPLRKYGEEGINLYGIVGSLAGRAYCIAMLELILNRNNLGPGEGEWTFGQLLAMMMLLGPFIELWSIIFAKKQDDEVILTELTEVLFFPYIFNIIACIIDLGVNAAAGAAAVAAGAKVNGDVLTADIVKLGAFAGVLKSGILNFSFLVSRGASNTVAMPLGFCLSTFGMAFIVTAAIAQKVLGEVPSELLLSAVVAGVPLLAGGGLQEATVFHYILMAEAAVPPSVAPVSVGWDALGGYTFARMAQNQNYDICNVGAAAAAGAVFGTIVIVWKIPYAAVWNSINDE